MKFKRKAVASEAAGLYQGVDCKATILETLTECVSLIIASPRVVGMWSAKKAAKRGWEARTAT
jgi:hypothetical protein